MERRDWSLEALEKLNYIDSLDDEPRAKSLEVWTNKYIQDQNFVQNLDLTSSELEKFSELFYKNIDFLKRYRETLRANLTDNTNIKKFLQ